MKTKICTQCKLELDIHAFTKVKSKSEKRRSKCKKCNNDVKKEYRRNNKEKGLSKEKQIRLKNKDQIAKSRLKPKEKYAARTLETKYGINLSDYNLLLKKQNSLCAICNKTSDKKLCVDHNHKTGSIRGLLCKECNFGLGNFKDNIAIFESAINYLNNGAKSSLKCCKAKIKNWRSLPFAERGLLRRYGINMKEYEDILMKQNNSCAICLNDKNYNKKMCVDHDHETLQIRGLLCISCNSGLGKFKNINDIIKAINYLKIYGV